MAISIDVLTELNRRSVERTAAQLEKRFRDVNVEISPEMDHRAMERAIAEAERRHKIKLETKVDIDYRRNIKGITEIDDALSQMGRTAFYVTRGLGTLAAVPIAGFLYETARVAVTASQSLALLPAAATAAAAGIGTLKLATTGFNEAMGNLGDLDKFNESLAKLGPNAAQAALAVRNNVMPALTTMQRQVEQTFFEGFDRQINQLSTVYAPRITGLTTSIAESFNKMGMGISGSLLQPANIAAMQETFGNIGKAFDAAAPAARIFTDAVIQLVNAGSTALPGLGDDLTEMAASFSAFITRVTSSGEFQKFMDEGIEAVKELGSTILDVGKFAYETFGGVSREEIKAWGTQIKDTLAVIGVLVTPLNEAFKLFNTTLGETSMKLGDLVNPLTTIIDAINNLRNNADDPRQKALDMLNEERAKRGEPPLGLQGNVLSTGGIQIPPGLGRGLGGPQAGVFPTVGGLPTWSNPANGNPLPDQARGRKPSDRARRDAIIAGLDPSLWRVDPFGGLPPGAGGPGFRPDMFSPQELLEEQNDVINAAHDLEERTKNRLALERDNQATAEQIYDAKWEEGEAQRKLQEQQADLVAQSKKTTKDLTSAFGEMGAALDPDLGISKGLAGLADNLVRFLGSIAAAPLMGRLSVMKQANEQATGITGGHGLLGMMAAQGAFGIDYRQQQTTGGSTSDYTSSGSTSLGQMAFSGGSRAAQMMALAQQSSGGKYSWGGSDLAAGLSDCSGAVSDLVEVITQGQATSQRLFSTADAGSVLSSLGAVSGAVPGALQIGWVNGGPGGGHMRATLPNGVAFESGGGTGQGATYGGPAKGAAGMPNIMSLPVGGGSGQVPIMAEPGEFVVNPTAASLFAPFLQRINGSFQTGGFIDKNGNPMSPGSAPGPSTRIGGVEPYSNPSGGGVGMAPGGTLESALSMAASAADAFAPGAGQAAQIGIKLANRAIQYAGQVAGIGVSGLMETFLPTGGSELANNNWLTRIAGGIAGAAPALPNLAGKGGDQPLTPEQVQANQQGGQAAPVVAGDFVINNNRDNLQGNIDDANRHLAAANAAPMVGAR